MKKLALLLLIVILCPTVLFAQNGKFNFGLNMKAGISQNFVSEDTKDEALFTPMFSSSVGGFCYWNFENNDSEHSTLYQSLRFSMAYSKRGGFFDISGSVEKISFSYLDLEVMIPLTFSVSPDINLFLGIGGVASFITNQTSDTPKAEIFHPGILLEVGVSTRYGSHFGCQFLSSYTTYEIHNIAITFGISFSQVKAIREREWTN